MSLEDEFVKVLADHADARVPEWPIPEEPDDGSTVRRHLAHQLVECLYVWMDKEHLAFAQVTYRKKGEAG